MAKGTPMTERRSEQRQFTCIPAGFEEPGDAIEHVALIRDVSPNGATLYIQQRLPIGEHLELGLHLDPDASLARPATARVVHCERRPWERADVWPWQAGIEFERPIDEYTGAIEALTRRQRAAGLSMS
jgi:hypothetical protein